jgi:hypothetical protein
VIFLTNTIRRTLGPFPWVPPPTWEAETILRGDYLLFPGMLFWYAVLPVATIGMILTGLELMRRRAVQPIVLFAAIFAAALAATYLTLNLSYRQRDFLFPFLLFPAALAFQTLAGRRLWRMAYLLCWIGIALLAVVHLTARLLLA